MKNDNVQEESAAVLAKARRAIAELKHKLVVEKRVTTEDLVAHLTAMSEALTEMGQTAVRLSEAAMCVVEVNEKLYQEMAGAPSGGRAPE